MILYCQVFNWLNYNKGRNNKEIIRKVLKLSCAVKWETTVVNTKLFCLVREQLKTF